VSGFISQRNSELIVLRPQQPLQQRAPCVACKLPWFPLGAGCKLPVPWLERNGTTAPHISPLRARQRGCQMPGPAEQMAHRMSTGIPMSRHSQMASIPRLCRSVRPSSLAARHGESRRSAVRPSATVIAKQPKIFNETESSPCQVGDALLAPSDPVVPIRCPVV
jgi:hypothetical protein